ncbi:fasciclin domain-containing protein [Sphingomonas sp.]|uniref:fasciclin domain-containing protein n=1 Tax=Sphingomonas sp. TaxID=28214 RepID=UPI0025F61591|nr:fasciclin domain-containing protein [Sphingomonas sp.]MBV9526926.1 fasciclin domain-containing protein [Sphingomonas sp.]
MNRIALMLGVGAALIVGGCGQGGGGNDASGQTPAATKAAGGQTIAAGLPANGQFMAAAKAAGIDKTLAGPGPYTVLVPDDAAFAKLPPGTIGNNADPQQRAKITSMLTYLILPGTVLAADIGKTIDNAHGKAVIMTVSGQTLTASKEGDAITLTDGSGNAAHITKADQQFSNGVVHQIDAVLMPPAPTSQGTPAK